ncbi:hypothetical protein Tco_1209725 [Tanacetum coccineum]
MEILPMSTSNNIAVGAYAIRVEVLILYQAYGNWYVMIGRKTQLLEDKQISSVWVFDEEEMRQDCSFTQRSLKNCAQCLETASGFLTTASELTSDDVKRFVTTSERNRLNETLEDLAKRRRQDSYDTVEPMD